MSKDYALRFKNVSKVYDLHGSPRDQLISVFGLHRIGIKPKTKSKKFIALNNINLEVPKGNRIGIVGRNGAGKSTLLKLLCGNFAPTQGEVEVNGEVQALMNVGLGFHPDYTGRQNVEASLQYNGLNKSEYKDVLKDIIDFCELGEFFDQPFKTYSLGMQARLMFASATAIRPDILIIDEVLGSGDAYFIAKSKSRVENMIKSGCTMILVSHSMQQILELCDKAIWLNQGTIQMEDDCFRVVKAYEQFLQGPIKTLSNKNGEPDLSSSLQHGQEFNDSTVSETKFLNLATKRKKQIKLQEPMFFPHITSPEFSKVEIDTKKYDFVELGGVSRWNASKLDKLTISGFTITNLSGKTNQLLALEPARFHITIKAIKSDNYSCRYGVNISNHAGQILVSVMSPEDIFHLSKDNSRLINLVFNPLQLGPGDYTIGIVILEYGKIEHVNKAARYDLLSRSFKFKVDLQSPLSTLNSQFFHSAEWNFLDETSL